VRKKKANGPFSQRGKEAMVSMDAPSKVEKGKNEKERYEPGKRDRTHKEERIQRKFLEDKGHLTVRQKWSHH